MSGARPRGPGAAATLPELALLAAAAAALTLADPWLGGLLPEGLRRAGWAEGLPLLAAPLALAALAAGLPLLTFVARPPAYETAFLFAAFAAAQLNGLRLGPLDVFDLALAVLLLVWIARRGLDPDRPIELPPLVLLGGALILLQTPYILEQNPVRWALGMFSMTRAVLVAFLIVNVCADRRRLRQAETILIAVATLSAALAVAQFALAYAGVFRFTLIDPPESAWKPTPLGMVMRASALCITAQHMSGFLLLATPAALWRFSTRWRARDGAALLLIWGGILVSWNYGAILAAAALGALFVFVRWPSLTPVLLAIGGGLAVAAWHTGLAELLWDLSFGDSGVAKGIDQRHTLFALGLEKLTRDPLIGTGLQGFAQFTGNFWARPVHNTPMQAATELGAPGAVIILAALLVPATQVLLLALRRGGEDAALARRALLVALGIGALWQSEPMLDHSNGWLMLGFVQAVAVVLSRPRRRGAGGSGEHGGEPGG
ncbi:MAG: hypothetical protein ACQEUZ_00460 [Pseudomonadota bacterium]